MYPVCSTDRKEHHLYFFLIDYMKSSGFAGAFSCRIESGWEPMGVFLWIQTQNQLSALMSGMNGLKRRAKRSHRAEYTHAWQNVSESQRHYGGSMSAKCPPYSLWYVQLFYSQTELCNSTYMTDIVLYNL